MVLMDFDWLWCGPVWHGSVTQWWSGRTLPYHALGVEALDQNCSLINNCYPQTEQNAK